MNFDDIDMTQSFKFKENQYMDSQNNLFQSNCGQQENEYICYQCGGYPFKAKNCSVCFGKEKINDNNPMSLLLAQYLKQKMCIVDNCQEGYKLSTKASINKISQQYQSIKQQQEPDEHHKTCQNCSEYYFQTSTLENPNICFDCHKVKKYKYEKKQKIYSYKVDDNGSSLNYNETVKRGILKDSLNSSSPSYLMSDSYNSKKSTSIKKKFLHFSPTRSNGTISPQKSDRSSRIKIIYDQSDSQFDQKSSTFKFSLNQVDNDNKDEFQCVKSSLKIQQQIKISHKIQIKENLSFNDYFCDNCGQMPYQYRFHCQQCEDYDLCKKCYCNRIQIHNDHNFTKICKQTQLIKKHKKQQQLRNTLFKSILSVSTIKK